MTNEELIIECKKGLNLALDDNSVDAVVLQKVLAVKAFLMGAGVQQSRIEGNLAVAVMVIGVNDLWSIEAGEIKFSPVFYTLATQLASGGGVVET